EVESDYSLTMQIALTFDAEHPDRPHCPPGVIDQIIAALGNAQVPATFFLQGRWVEAYPHVTEEIGRGPHRLGNHSYYHARLRPCPSSSIGCRMPEASSSRWTICGHPRSRGTFRL